MKHKMKTLSNEIDLKDAELKDLEERIKALNSRILELESSIKKFLTANGHDLCHLNRLELYKVLGDETLNKDLPSMVSRKDFEEGCKKYANELYGE